MPDTLNSILLELLAKHGIGGQYLQKEFIALTHQKIEMLIPKEYYGIDLRFNEGWNAYREEMLKKLREGKNE